eukprot:COSAG02_NODE_1284_length_13466_cov_4.862572_3_plen_70_part_00
MLLLRVRTGVFVVSGYGRTGGVACSEHISASLARARQEGKTTTVNPNATAVLVRTPSVDDGQVSDMGET